MGIFFKKKQAVITDTALSNDENLQQINQEIYKHNLELAIVNKTLSLLRKLYQISLLTLDPISLSEKMSDVVRIDLNMETVGIFSFDKDLDTLSPFSFSKSERLSTILNKSGFLFKDFKINSISSNKFLNEVVHNKVSKLTTDLNDIWGGIIEADKLKNIKEEAHLKTILLYPLITHDEVMGICLFGLNHDYELMNDHEKDSIKSLIDVVAVALDKAYLYKELQDANEKLKSLDKLKTEFLSLASHQLRSPLTAIKGYTSMILEGDYGEINPKAKEAIDRVFQSSNNLTMIVEDLLNVSKIEQGGMKYERTNFDLSEIASAMAKDLSINAEKKGLKLTYTQDEGIHNVFGDKEKLRQVVLNFIDNSIKYTKEGKVEVSVIHKEGNKVIRFEVKDTGMGMTPETKASLFQKFARGEGSKVNASGSGLGLYLAKEIAEAHKGTVGVDSDGPGKGSTFYMELSSVQPGT